MAGAGVDSPPAEAMEIVHEDLETEAADAVVAEDSSGEDEDDYDASSGEEGEEDAIPPPQPPSTCGVPPLPCEALLAASEAPAAAADDDAVVKVVRETYRTLPPRPHQVEAVVELLRAVVRHTATQAATQQQQQQPPRIPPKQSGKKPSAAATAESRAARNFLIQHAAGSGKSLTIACLTTLLCRLATATNGGGWRFEKVIVINDRKHLDAQLGEAVRELLAANGVPSNVVVRVRHTRTLVEALSSPTVRVVITTLQKFAAHKRLGTASAAAGSAKPHPLSLLGTSPTAIISDEAHRSYGAASTRRLHELLTGNTRQSANLTYFAFTSTPSAKCLEMFGDRTKNPSFVVPFHSFTFLQALEAGLIVDFLKNYTHVPVNVILQDTRMDDDQGPAFKDGLKAVQHLLTETSKHVVSLILFFFSFSLTHTHTRTQTKKCSKAIIRG